MNDPFIGPIFINLAISHYQFETIHAYKDGNGDWVEINTNSSSYIN